MEYGLACRRNACSRLHCGMCCCGTYAIAAKIHTHTDELVGRRNALRAISTAGLPGLLRPSRTGTAVRQLDLRRERARYLSLGLHRRDRPRRLDEPLARSD